MKVLLINGSPRENGNTARALKEVADTLASDGVDTETIWIGKKPVRGCVACYQCMNKPFEMLNCPVATSQCWNVVFGRDEGECGRDTEGMQTMRTLGRNMAWLLKNLKRGDAIPRSADEPWQPMHFIR